MFGNPDPPDMDELKRQITLGLMEMGGLLEPVYDFADGMKRDLEARGWSPAAAELSATSWLSGQLHTIGRGGQ